MNKFLQNLLFIFIILISACSHEEIKPPEKTSIKRIITLSPAITEIISALGEGENIIGNTKYCNYPPEQAKKAKIGGFYDVNLEKILMLSPDLVILPEENYKALKYLNEMGIETLTVKTVSIEDIFTSIYAVGYKLNQTEKAEKLVKDLKSKFTSLKAEKQNKKVLFIVDRDTKNSNSLSFFAAGNDNFFNTMIANSGAENIFGKSEKAYPMISSEAVITMNPDIIIEIVPKDFKENEKELRESWKKLNKVSAVQKDNIFFLDEGFESVPGPRFIKTFSKISAIIKNAK